MPRPVSNRFPYALMGKPYAQARMEGSSLAPNLDGEVRFYPVDNGTLVAAEVSGLPRTQAGTASTPPIGPFGFHLHDGSVCNPMGAEPFESAMGHYNPTGQPHPLHAGDFPVLFSNNGYAYMVFYTDRFKPSDIVGKTVIIHQNPDDFRTQPAGASGKRIGCGVVKKM